MAAALVAAAVLSPPVQSTALPAASKGNQYLVGEGRGTPRGSEIDSSPLEARRGKPLLGDAARDRRTATTATEPAARVSACRHSPTRRNCAMSCRALATTRRRRRSSGSRSHGHRIDGADGGRACRRDGGLAASRGDDRWRDPGLEKALSRDTIEPDSEEESTRTTSQPQSPLAGIPLTWPGGGASADPHGGAHQRYRQPGRNRRVQVTNLLIVHTSARIPTSRMDRSRAWADGCSARPGLARCTPPSSCSVERRPARPGADRRQANTKGTRTWCVNVCWCAAHDRRLRRAAS